MGHNMRTQFYLDQYIGEPKLSKWQEVWIIRVNKFPLYPVDSAVKFRKTLQTLIDIEFLRSNKILPRDNNNEATRILTSWVLHSHVPVWMKMVTFRVHFRGNHPHLFSYGNPKRKVRCAQP